MPQARQIVQKLLAEKLAFAPEDRDGKKDFRSPLRAPSKSLWQALSRKFHKP